ncbi:MAG: hypothetical protein M1819_004602 [Sarea resinae]|nr:MAG: hypothetical protein M1819_004602 [Sarea resinae]
MKSRLSSPQPDRVRPRTFRLASGAEPLKPPDEDPFQSTMNGLNGFSQASSTPIRRSSSYSSQMVADGHDETAPSRSPPVFTPRVTSQSFGLDTSVSPPPPNLDLSPTGRQSPQWSSAVGRAATGKSGRVIERLMAENDRLRRELNLQTLRREEEQRRSEMARAAMESLKARNENLTQIHETNLATLTRRERKIEDLRMDLETERSRRERIEKESREICKERDETVEQYRREVNEEREKARKAINQHDVLASSWNQLDASYKSKVQALREDLDKLRNEKREDERTLKQLDVVCEQTKQESEKMRRSKEAIGLKFEDYQKETEDALRHIKEKSASNDVRNGQAVKELERVMGEMKYVINVARDVREAD